MIINLLLSAKQWPTRHKMVSRRKILSRSRDELHSDFYNHEEQDDIWLSKEKLYKVSSSEKSGAKKE